jgi:DNA-directed RNA polymerase subunit beta'
MNIQAFEPVLVEEEAIKLHPLVCASFGADFDGDAMAVHIPLSEDALKEAKHLLMSTNNILSPATGKPIIKPSQDVILGIYYMTKEKSPAKGEGKIFSCPSEVHIAFNNNELELHSKIKVRINEELIETTTGRILLKEIIPIAIPFNFYNKEIGSRELSELINLSYQLYEQKVVVRFCDSLKRFGFEQATRSGISIGIKDVTIPLKKEDLIKKGYKTVNQIEDRFNKGHITEEKKREDIINIWDDITEKVKKMLEEQDSCNPLSMMIHSGARGNIHQLMEMAGMKGIMNNSYGETLEQPITSNYRDG